MKNWTNVRAFWIGCLIGAGVMLIIANCYHFFWAFFN